MKKLLIISIALAIATSVQAQMKIGYISVNHMISLMPEFKKLDTLLRKFNLDSLAPHYEYLVSEYFRKDSLLNAKELPDAVKANIRRELQEITYTINNWESLKTQAIEAKQQDYLRPIYTKVFDAIKVVAREKGYTHVLDKDSVLIGPEGDDMIQEVARKLKVHIQKQIGTQIPGQK